MQFVGHSNILTVDYLEETGVTIPIFIYSNIETE